MSHSRRYYEHFEPEPDYRIRCHRHTFTKIARHNERFNLSQLPALYEQYSTKSITSVYKGRLLDLVSHFDDIFGIKYKNNATLIISLIFKRKHHKHEERDRDHHQHQNKHKSVSETDINVDPEEALRNFEKDLSSLSDKSEATNVRNVINATSSYIDFFAYSKIRELDKINDRNDMQTEPPLKKQKLTDIKIEKISVENWNFYAIIYWLNRVNNGAFKGVKYMCLRRGIFTAKMKGFELPQITNMVLRMNGIQNIVEQQYLLNSIDDLIVNNSFDNLIAKTVKTDMVPMEYCDAVSFEIMDNPIKIAQSGLVYERDFIEGYIKEYNEDPITKQHVSSRNITRSMIFCDQLKDKINVWKNNF